MSDRVISSTGSYTGYSAAVTIDAASDYLLLQQSGVYKKINRNTLLGVTGTPADLTTVQTVQNKVLDNTNTVTLKTSKFTLQDGSDTTKQAVFSISGNTTGTTRTYTFPDANSTVVTTAATQTLTNKTLTSPTITGGSISNTTISVDAISEFTAANGVTIDSLNIKDGKLNTNNSVVTANITDTAVTPAKLQSGTGSGWAWASFVPTWTNLTVGNGTVTAEYIQIGKNVRFFVKVVFGSTTSVAGTISMNLPVTAKASWATGGGGAAYAGLASFQDASAAFYFGTGSFSTTAVTFNYYGVTATLIQPLAVNATAPFTWTTSDALYFSVEYQAA